tara:strand:- start:506 stop:994 length:489 start_codon:yes stop_codon:yes gene_type:complete
MNIPLINIKDVQNFADLSVGVNERKYNQYIIMAQERFLGELIGSTCMDDLIERKCTNMLTTADEALLVLLTPYLVAQSYALYIGSSMKLSLNSGVATLSGDNATVIGQQSRINESKSYILLAERQAKKIVTFLTDNATSYPCFDVDSCVKNDDFIHSIYFGL